VLPITINPRMVRIGLAGAGEGLTRRAALLAESGADAVSVASESSDAALHRLSVLFIAGLERSIAAELMRRARSGGVLVNVEDAPELSDFHVPAVVRRGRLILAVSTGGWSPGLARRLREWLQRRFGPEWDERLDVLGAARAGWRADGLLPGEVSRRTRELIENRGWLS
jgi:precorrin-2 dehydrogenase / sirohydrochlorin ferrochelatase